MSRFRIKMYFIIFLFLLVSISRTALVRGRLIWYNRLERSPFIHSFRPEFLRRTHTFFTQNEWQEEYFTWEN